jgi:cellulose synthase/poly-beta-1,6-N-acetylglucosamine synthase-like glycosyltransferase
METLFLVLIFLTVYAYGFYPIVLRGLAGIFANPWRREDVNPRGSIVISAYNEEDMIEQKVINALFLDYPPQLLKVEVGSDGSTDQTDQILAKLNHSCLTRHIFPERWGKQSV